MDEKNGLLRYALAPVASQTQMGRVKNHFCKFTVRFGEIPWFDDQD